METEHNGPVCVCVCVCVCVLHKQSPESRLQFDIESNHGESFKFWMTHNYSVCRQLRPEKDSPHLPWKTFRAHHINKLRIITQPAVYRCHVCLDLSLLCRNITSTSKQGTRVITGTNKNLDSWHSLKGCGHHKSELFFSSFTDSKENPDNWSWTYRARRFSGVPTVWYFVWPLNQRDISCTRFPTRLCPVVITPSPNGSSGPAVTGWCQFTEKLIHSLMPENLKVESKLENNDMAATHGCNYITGEMIIQKW